MVLGAMQMPQEDVPTTGLEDLPDEVLAQVLAGAGGNGVCNAARTCSRLHQLWKQQLTPQACFASALSLKSDLKNALDDAAERARDGLMGEQQCRLWGMKTCRMVFHKPRTFVYNKIDVNTLLVSITWYLQVPATSPSFSYRATNWITRSLNWHARQLLRLFSRPRTREMKMPLTQETLQGALQG